MLSSKMYNFYSDKSRNFNKLYYYTCISKFIKIEDNIELKNIFFVTNSQDLFYFNSYTHHQTPTYFNKEIPCF